MLQIPLTQKQGKGRDEEFLAGPVHTRNKRGPLAVEFAFDKSEVRELPSRKASEKLCFGLF